MIINIGVALILMGVLSGCNARPSHGDSPEELVKYIQAPPFFARAGTGTMPAFPLVGGSGGYHVDRIVEIMSSSRYRNVLADGLNGELAVRQVCALSFSFLDDVREHGAIYADLLDLTMDDDVLVQYFVLHKLRECKQHPSAKAAAIQAFSDLLRKLPKTDERHIEYALKAIYACKDILGTQCPSVNRQYEKLQQTYQFYLP